MRITVVGAGLAGSLLAVFLARRGLEVTVFESRPDMRRTGVTAGRSINLALANRGIAALDAVGLMPEVEPLLTPMAGRMLHPVEGELGFQPYGQTEQEVIFSVSRGGLNQVLLDAAEQAGARLVFERPCRGYDFDTGSLLFDDGDVPTDPVIATDGAGSPIRNAMVDAYDIGVSEDLLEHGYKELTMPAVDGRHAMDANALHIWPRGGFMLIALPNLDGSFTVTLFLPHEGAEASFASLTDEAAVEDFFRRRFPDALELIPGLARQFSENPTGIMGTVRTGRWHIDGRVLLLGDAAHAVVPFHGQGMNCAFEDCLELDSRLEAHGEDWETVFAETAQARKPNADAIADMALENYIEMRDLVAQPRFQLQKKLEFVLEQRHPGVFIRRYGLVMFHTLPYAEAQRRGALQQRILDELTEGAASLDDIDLDRADRLIAEHCRW